MSLHRGRLYIHKHAKATLETESVASECNYLEKHT